MWLGGVGNWTANPVISGQLSLFLELQTDIYMVKYLLWPGSDMFSIKLKAMTCGQLWELDLAVWCIQERARVLPAAQEHWATALSSHACSGVMGKQWDHRLRVGLCLQPVFLSCTECLLKTHQPLWERGQLTPLISSAGRDTVSPWTTCHPKWPSGHTEEAAVSHV